jgi:hypothetical protein
MKMLTLPGEVTRRLLRISEVRAAADMGDNLEFLSNWSDATNSGELQRVFQQGFLPSKHAKTASLVIFSREAIRRAGSSGPVTLFPPSPASSREALFEVYCTRVSLLLVFWGTVGNSK